MYTLRRIDQNGIGLEKTTNNYLGKEYTIIHKIPCDNVNNVKSEFEELCENYFGMDVSNQKIKGGDETQIPRDKFEFLGGFVVDEGGKMLPFFTNHSTYIVGLDGKTIERVYGTYSKH